MKNRNTQCMSVGLAFAIANFFVLASFPTDAKENHHSGIAGAVVTAFINNEFLGEVDQRAAHGAFGVDANMVFGDTLNELSHPGLILSLFADSMVLVDKFSIGEVVVEGAGASVAVTFDVLGLTAGYGLPGRKIIVTPRKVETVRYTMRWLGDDWKIDNPPIPRVSVDVMVSRYRDEIQAMSKIVEAPGSTASDAQKEVFVDLQLEFGKISEIRDGSSAPPEALDP